MGEYTRIDCTGLADAVHLWRLDLHLQGGRWICPGCQILLQICTASISLIERYRSWENIRVQIPGACTELANAIHLWRLDLHLQGGRWIRPSCEILLKICTASISLIERFRSWENIRVQIPGACTELANAIHLWRLDLHLQGGQWIRPSCQILLQICTASISLIERYRSWEKSGTNTGRLHRAC